MDVAALYVDVEAGPYAGMAGVDAWGVERDAKLYRGPHPVVAHPPCGPWGRLSALCTRQDPSCGPRAVEQVRAFGGVLEHPVHSRLWKVMNLPRPGEFSFDGLWTLELDQCRWGHRCRKRTWLLMSGVPRSAVGPLPPWQEPTHCIDDGAARLGGRPSRWLKMPSGETHLTPPAFAEWLVALARTAREPCAPQVVG